MNVPLPSEPGAYLLFVDLGAPQDPKIGPGDTEDVAENRQRSGFHQEVPAAAAGA